MATERQVLASALSGSRRRRNHAIWLGLLLSFVGLFTYGYTVRFPALRDFPWVNLPLVIVGASLSAVGFWRTVQPRSAYRGKILGLLGLGLTLAIAVFFSYTVFFLTTHLPTPTQAAQSMTTAPDFTLMNQEGQSVRLRQYRGKKVVIIFYRGYW